MTASDNTDSKVGVYSWQDLEQSMGNQPHSDKEPSVRLAEKRQKKYPYVNTR